MSPLSRNRLYIAISPEHISLLKVKRGLKIKLQAKHDEAITSVGKQPSWQPALDRLTQLLAQEEWQNVEVNIVLSNRLVRYTTILFSAQLQNYAEQEAFARHALRQTYGTAVEQWTLRIQRGKAGLRWLVSAIDHQLLEELRQVCATHKLALRSVTPYLMPVFNRYHKVIKTDPAWLVINEPGYSLFALLSGNQFIAVNGMYQDHLHELHMLLDRENLACSLPEPCKTIYLYSAAENSLSTMSKTGYEFSKLDMTMLDGFPSSAEGLYAMAMSEIL